MNLEKKYTKKLEVGQLKFTSVSNFLLYRLLVKQTKSLLKSIKKDMKMNEKRAKHIDAAITPPYENGLTNDQGAYCIIRETGSMINYWWDTTDKWSRCDPIQDYYEEKTNSIKTFLILINQLKENLLFQKNQNSLIQFYALLGLIEDVYYKTMILYREKLLNFQDKKIELVEELIDFLSKNSDIAEFETLKR